MMKDIYILWTRKESDSAWSIFGYTKDGQGAVTWKNSAGKGAHRRYERPNVDSCSAAEYFKHCGDCGKFVCKDRWIRKDNSAGKTHALCYDCLSNYDGPEYH